MPHDANVSHTVFTNIFDYIKMKNNFNFDKGKNIIKGTVFRVSV